MNKFFFHGVALVFGAIIALWAVGTFLLSAPSSSDKKMVFVIPKGSAVVIIAENLQQRGLIRSALAFQMLVHWQGLTSQLQAGDFKLSPAMDAAKIVQALTHGSADVWVTLLEGWRTEEMAQKLSESLGMQNEAFLKVAAEGFMFPDTYLMPRTASASAVAALLKKTFQDKTKDLAPRLAQQKLTNNEWVILASIVERESRGIEPDEREIIAGILIKRYRAGMPLEADATLQYALGYSEQEKTWWRKKLTEADLRVKSPYNTRINPGLPPTPICNPGLASLQAVASPRQSVYWFYLHDKEGKPRYAATIDEHVANVRKYL